MNLDAAPNSPDSEVARLAAQDEPFLGELFTRHRERLLRTVRFRMDRRLLGRVDADDILQEAYLDGAQRLKHISASPPPSAFLWLRSITLQTLINVHRRHLGAKIRDANREVSLQSPGWTQPSSVSLAAKLLDSLTSPSLAAIRQEVTEQLEEALETLAPIDREVLALRHFEELSNREVAEVLEIQQKAASVRYVRALGRLQKVLEQFPALADDRTLTDDDPTAEAQDRD
ncbi:MAG: sigma-70 family RNA polymerase sigma factor [Planctomycetales bacterium]|nr:sigma-70 family RNA polymerase sigma factor [Planctomycetales bacterium]